MKKIAYVTDVRFLDDEIAKRGGLEMTIDNVGFAISKIALTMLGGSYGKRVLIDVGPGSNGADARATALQLERRGVKVVLKELKDRSSSDVDGVDLYVDGVLGVGVNRDYLPRLLPDDLPVLAIDVPSGLDADRGIVHGGCQRADVTATIGALKPGLMQNQGPEFSGEIELVLSDIYKNTLATSLIEDSDVLEYLPASSLADHKWCHSVFTLAGSESMMGAAELSTLASYRIASGIVHLYYPLATPVKQGVDLALSPEIVRVGLESLWAEPVIDAAKRFRAIVIGPGLGRSLQISNLVRRLLAHSNVPAVVDADGIFALGEPARLERLARGRSAPIVITPHEGEFNSFFEPIGLAVQAKEDRIDVARRAALASASIVLLKGSPTVVATPSGVVYVVTSGSSRLAVAGTGDVLSGVIGGLFARGVEPALAAALGAHIHGRASSYLGGYSIRASELIDACSSWLSTLDKRWHAGPESI